MSSVFQAQGFFFKVYKTQIKHKETKHREKRNCRKTVVLKTRLGKNHGELLTWKMKRRVLVQLALENVVQVKEEAR